MTSGQDAKARLRAAGLRVTSPRLTVLDVLRKQPHSTLDEIRQAATAHLGSLSTQATYDILAALHGARIIRRIEPAGSPPRYELAIDNHHHLICRSCGQLRDAGCQVGTAPCLTPESSFGYVVDEAEVIYWGLCPTCAEEEQS